MTWKFGYVRFVVKLKYTKNTWDGPLQLDFLLLPVAYQGVDRKFMVNISWFLKTGLDSELIANEIV